MELWMYYKYNSGTSRNSRHVIGPPMVLPLRLNLHPSPSPLFHYHILGSSLIHYFALVPLAPQGHISSSLGFPYEEPSPVQSQSILKTLGPSFLYSHGFPLALLAPNRFEMVPLALPVPPVLAVLPEPCRALFLSLSANF